MLDHLSTYVVNMSATGNNLNQQQQQQSMAGIKRPQHNTKLSNVLNNMLQCGSLVDVTIHCDDGQLNAHKLVLAAASSYFRNLFTSMTNTFQYPIIVLREMPVNDLKTIIQLIYTGEIHVPQNRVDSVMRCANYLQIDGMASSANSLNAVLASSSSMSHHPLIAPVSAISNPMTTNTATSINKIHPQYPTANQVSGTKQSRGHSSRSYANANNNTNSTTTNSNHSNFMNGSSTANNNSNNTNSSGKQRHTCQICFKTFTHGFTLKRHMKLHSQGRNTIYCDVCSKSYSCKDSFLRHKKSSGHIQHAEFHHRNIGSDT